MSPRRGGESDKFGNRYEAAWTVRHVLYVLAGFGNSITVEDIGELGEGVEFTYRRPNGVEVHQLKRQNRTINNWSVASLHSLEIWANASNHADAGREFHFVSAIPARVPQELCDFARRSPSLQAFVDSWLPNQPVRDAFDELSAPKILGSPEAAWKMLRGTWIEWPDERDVVQVNAVLSALLLEGASGLLPASGLGDLVLQNLGVELTARAISDRLGAYGLRRVSQNRSAAMDERVRELTASWFDSVERELLRPVIPRDETDELLRLIASTEEGLIFVAGAAGGGKSTVLHQAIEHARTDRLHVLAFRLDRLEPFLTTAELGIRLGLDVSPVAALAAAAGDRASLLVIDQLDAVSLASGRMPRNFDVIADLTREASAFRSMRIMLACRKFDIDNDHRIRELTTRSTTATVTVSSLTDLQVDAAVTAMEIDAGALTDQQKVVLKTPLHLVLLASVATQSNALNFQTSGHLFDAFWERKRRDVRARRDGTRFETVTSVVALAISNRQRLSVPAAVLDQDDLASDADVLVSEHVLVRNGREIAFFHESFFDYAFARHWLALDDSIVDFLTRGEQELFRRAQVRQIMTHLRDSDPARFVGEVRSLLTSDRIRFHIKDAVLAVLGGLSDPTTPEADTVIDVAASHPSFEARLWRHMRTPFWFDRFDTDGHIVGWLSATEELQSRAIEFMASVARSRPDRLAELLAEHRETPTYPAWLRRVLSFADLADRRVLFDLYLDAVRHGLYSEFEEELWMAVHNLANEHPNWAVEVLAVLLVDRPGALDRDDQGRISILRSRDSTGVQLATESATGAPKQFSETLLPYLQRVMEITAEPDVGEGLKLDPHFSHRYPGDESDPNLGEALFTGMASAIRTQVKAAPAAMRPTLDRLAADMHESAQWLLYQGLLAGGKEYADWAAQLLLEGPYRFLCGYTTNGVWTTRQVLQAISPAISDESFSRLEASIRAMRFSWERRGSGWYAFNLLSALDEQRLSETGRRRLGELRRVFNKEQPEEPEGIVAGVIGPPIPGTAAQHMSDDNWLQAMGRHDGDQRNFGTLTGGAHELSQVLQQQVRDDPRRFARLAMRLTPNINAAYASAILFGLGEADPIDDQDVAFAAIRHLVSLGHPDSDRWIRPSLRPYLKTAPLEIVELIRDRAVATFDSTIDGIRRSAQGESGRQVPDITTSGLNTARGSLVAALADLLTYDTNGDRTALVVPALNRFATDPSVPVRSCTVRLVLATMRHARSEAIEAFWKLIDTDDALLATEGTIRILVHLGNEQASTIHSAMERMLLSPNDKVRGAGGQLAAFAAMEWEIQNYLDDALGGTDSATRKGVAEMSAHHLADTASTDIAANALAALMDDGDDAVRNEVAQVAGALRGQPLRPFEAILKQLILSNAFVAALPQLLISLERAPDRVDDIALLCAQRFVAVLGSDAGKIQTKGVARARGVGQLVLRGLAQTRTKEDRATLLDLLDDLLIHGAYGLEDAITASER
ncbi:ATP-binding protein [Rhodococcus opacus]|uniref:ATP-binding protein n=1 Tax=Rhodococcus opacus TaxID=37919 RepID=UPI002953E15F|nr:ATP-binding protein [Rhodococcus opacus]MDV7091008.1 ATP-binding protein [Rhodococcus opacus]